MTFAETPDMAFRLWADAFDRADRDGMEAMFEDDAVLLLPPGERLLRGRKAICEVAHAFATSSSFEIHDIEVLENGDLAMVYVTRTRTTTEPDGTVQRVTGTTTDVVRQQSDGRWLIVIDNPNGTRVRPAESSSTSGSGNVG
ncbi:MAG: SgcJ/EcaC family oxidoreductase [Actinomycetota bacterium]|nr:SgcJ/EcaC family oxidoreductase [Actinomycetota bacterium]